MKSRMGLKWLFAILALALSPIFAKAQTGGFQAGIAPQATFGFPAAQSPAAVTRGTFVGMPMTGVATPQQTLPLFPSSSFPSFPTVIIPNPILMPRQPTIAPSAFGPNGRHLPAPGTPRSEVVSRFGAPSVTVITSTGETLYFTGGVTVIIQNGQVAGPR